MSQNSEKRHVSFAAIDQYVETNIVLPTEKVTNRDFVEWGKGNNYPGYLLGLYNNVTTLRSIINGNIDFVTGDDVTILPLGDRFAEGIMNTRGDLITDIVRDLAKDYNLYGGFALQIIRDHNGDVAEIYYIDMRFIRSNKENDVFYYNEHWEKGGRKDVIIYPKFLRNLDWASLTDEERDRHASSILFVKNVHTQVYPAPMYAASVLSCEIEKAISQYHWNSLNNNFCPDIIINFNNGDPGDEIKEEIVSDLEEKFSGYQNGKRFMVSFNKDRMSAVTIDAIKTDDFSERYKALEESCRRQIFAAFRAQPLLFGLNMDVSTGFSTDEFEQTFKLYNRTQIRPVQRLIADAFDRIYGSKGVLTIKPFSLESNTEQEVN
ncbi:MAG: phage portal protein [Prevotella sp.]|nr:phage portal protein [Prevotella sp.]